MPHYLIYNNSNHKAMHIHYYRLNNLIALLEWFDYLRKLMKCFLLIFPGLTIL